MCILATPYNNTQQQHYNFYHSPIHSINHSYNQSINYSITDSFRPTTCLPPPSFPSPFYPSFHLSQSPSHASPVPSYFPAPFRLSSRHIPPPSLSIFSSTNFSVCERNVCLHISHLYMYLQHVHWKLYIW